MAPGSLRSSYERHAPWLAPEQKAAWDAFIRMQEKLIGRLSRQIQADSASPPRTTWCWPSSPRPADRMRFTELARLLEWEKSRMSHQVTRMAKRGLVAREECPDDGRGSSSPPPRTAAGPSRRPRRSMSRTSVGFFVDALTQEELDTFADLSRRVLAHMERQPG